ncbi:putative quinol monooxygenase [Parerythrobacter aurantius]|uniref:putative quinol monooxygenase n=1 Tax=Parerythrobacter aurantius TaxID=3127706 RepID=UPI003F4984E5
MAFLAACQPKNGAVIAMDEVQFEGIYGLIGEIKAVPGKGAKLAAILQESSGSGMPGNLAYIVSQGVEDPDSIWVSEVWASKQAHDDSIKLPAVQAAIAKGRAMIAGFGTRIETRPLGFGG